MNTSNPPATELDEALATSIRMAAHVASTLVLVGRRQFDRFCVSSSEAPPRVTSLEQLAHDALDAAATWVFDPRSEQVKLLRCADGYTLPSTGLPKDYGDGVRLPLAQALDAFASLGAPTQGSRLVLLIDAGLLFEDPATPHGDDFQALRAIEHQSRNAARSHMLLMRVSLAGAMPSALLANPKVRTVHVPSATRDVRNAYARLRCSALAEQCNSTPDAVARVVAACTEEWNLDLLESLLQASLQNGLSNLIEIEEVSRAIRVGTAKSPWVGQQIREVVGQAEANLEARVKGQPQALKAVVTALKKACVGLVGAHESRNTTTPRAAMVFAGPTGTGKTELAKAIAMMVYGDETLIRFDMAEFRADHAVSRMLGAPPGYVGHEKGGELTDAVRAKPNSVILFDEIEKAHPRIWDIFLSILSDGRLTNGTGQTADFSQAVIIFTTNLGMYEEQPDGLGGICRVPRFQYSTPFERVQAQVQEVIRAEFVNKLGRPEILGRLGGHQSIVVLDFLRDLHGVGAKFINNLSERCQRLHGMDLEVTPVLLNALVASFQSKPEAVLLGGRGLATDMDRLLVEPLSAYLFDAYPKPKRLCADWEQGKTIFRCAD